MINVIYGTKIDYVKNQCHIFLNKEKGIIKQTFDYKNDSNLDILNSINQINLLDSYESNDNEFYSINNPSFLTSKTNSDRKFLENLLLSNKNIICLIVVKNKNSFNENVLNNKAFKFIEATIINDSKKISLANYYIQQSNLKFDCETTKSQFIAKLNNDPFFIENEIKKMANYANGVEINSNDVNVLCLNGINDNIFNLLIYILTKQKTKAFKLFNDLVKQKVQIINILQTISVQLFQLKLQKMLIEKYKFNFASKSLTELGINSFIVQKNLPILNLYTIDKLNQLLEKILLLDYNIKSNIVIPTIAFQLFVSEI